MHVDLQKYQLRSLSFFEMLSAQEAEFAKARLQRREFKPGQTLIREGTYSKGIYIIRSGKVKIHTSNLDGRESIIYIYKKGEFFGYRPMIGHELNPASATAMDQVVVSFLPREVFFEILDTSAVFARNLLASSTSEFTVWINKIALFSQHTVKERTAMALLILGKVYHSGRRPSKHLTINIRRDDLAAYIGAVTETVVRMLRFFKDAGLISTSGTKITVLKQEELSGLLRFL